LSVGTLTSIHEAVQHNVTQSATEIRRTVSRKETHLTVKHHKQIQRVVVKERNKVIGEMAPPEVGFSMRTSMGSIRQYAHENDMRRLVERHADEDDSFHLDIHHFCVLSATFSDE
jgi:hypothetical protein